MKAPIKTLIITGASKGIGFEIAKLFLDAHYRVINVSRTTAPHAGIENLLLDLSEVDAERKLKLWLDSHGITGEICLVHNAAMLSNDHVARTSTAQFKAVLDLNIVAPHYINQLIIPLMAPDSSIIYIGSTLSEKAVPMAYSYIVSKHALVGMMRATCQDLAGTGIHTSCICPGFTNTEMLRRHLQDKTDSIKALSTFNRLIEPSEIANCVFFTAQNPVSNGSVFHVNLGQVES